MSLEPAKAWTQKLAPRTLNGIMVVYRAARTVNNIEDAQMMQNM